MIKYHLTRIVRLDYQPLFGKGARAQVDQTRESGGNRAYRFVDVSVFTAI